TEYNVRRPHNSQPVANNGRVGGRETQGGTVMLASVDRQTALELLAVEHKAVRDLIDALDDEEMTRPDTIRHGLYAGQECSFKDLLAHLTTYEVYAREAIDCWLRGEKHWISDAMRDPARSREIHFG